MTGDCTYQIIGADRADFPALISLWKESVEATHAFLRPADFADLESEMAKTYLPAMREIWLYRQQELIAGFCANNGAHIEMLFVRPGYMRQGIGRRLLEHVRKSHGPLTVDVNEENREALAFYLHCGFQVTGRSALDGQGRSYPLLHLAESGLQTG